MIISVLAAFVVALIAPWLARLTKEYTGWVLALVPAGIAVYFASQLGTIAAGETVREAWAWVPGMDIAFSFYLDGLSILFALVITVVGTLIVIYGGGYLAGDPNLPRFYLSVLMFMGSMLGVVLSDNLITLFVFWELTSFTSYLLIAYKHEYQSARDAARQALLVTGAGGLALLAGLIMMQIVSGTYEISEMLAMGDVFRESPLYLGIFIMVIAGAFTKSAQFPFYFWLPNAMEAPTPVSAYLHSATMVKAGIYLLARMHPMLGDTDLWFITLTSFGAVTMLVSAWLAVHYTDLKRVLAYTTVMALGLLTMLLGLGTPDAIVACMVFIVVHSLYKGSLFMVAGAVDHSTGTRDALALGGLRRAMPLVTIAAFLSGLSMMGFPALFGFIGKELVYEAALAYADYHFVLVALAVLANIAVVVAAGVVALRPFIGAVTPAAEHAHHVPVSMWLGPLVLGVLGLLFGVFPHLVDATLFVPAVAAVLNVPHDFYLVIWHGVNAALILSVLTVGAGVALYLGWTRYRNSPFMRGFAHLFGVLPERGYDRTLDGLVWTADVQTRFLQSGTLRYYVATIAVTMALVVGITIFVTTGFVWQLDVAGVRAYEWAVAGAILAAAGGAVLLRTRLAAALSAGVAGFGVAVLFLFYGAPDLAMTQFLIETLTAILIVLIIVNIPKMPAKYHQTGNHGARRFRDAVIALGSGAMITMAMLVALRIPFNDELSQFFAEHAYTEAHGRNIVNVILVDFRGLDTFGEVVVLAVAAIGIYALIRMKRVETTPGTPDAETGKENVPV
jgi:multicomponent Na+:H+ antiporter subunit A